MRRPALTQKVVCGLMELVSLVDQDIGADYEQGRADDPIHEAVEYLHKLVGWALSKQRREPRIGADVADIMVVQPEEASVLKNEVHLVPTTRRDGMVTIHDDGTVSYLDTYYRQWFRREARLITSTGLAMQTTEDQAKITQAKAKNERGERCSSD